jgi:CBS domain-containing protein
MATPHLNQFDPGPFCPGKYHKTFDFSGQEIFTIHAIAYYLNESADCDISEEGIMITIKQILADKKKPLTIVAPEDTVLSALKVMRDRDIGAVLVVDNGKLIGMFTERDCLHKVSSLGIDPQDIKIKDVMSVKVRYVTPTMEVSQCLALMTERFFRHLPVLDEQDNLLGIVSIGDLVKAKISDQDFVIGQLEHYIHT